jgi:CDP-glycerol glycerophosphotransferase (TagB/SpsB family)
VHAIESTPRLGDEDVPTVLYAPTWEGVNAGQEYSSIAAIGATLVSALLAADPPVRVVYKPHPFTGQRDAKYRDHDARVAGLIDVAAQRSGIDHRVVRSGPIEHWFNQAAVLATDISSVVSDFLASEKPYAVFNHTDLDDDAFGDSYRSASGGIILGRDGRGIDELVALVTRRAQDRRTEIRARLATYLLGPPEMRTLESFQDAVDALVARADAERAGYREET